MPPIETLADWNARLGCCCVMPECPVPDVEREIKHGTGDSETVEEVWDPVLEEYVIVSVTPHGVSHAIDEAMADLSGASYPEPWPTGLDGADLAVTESVGMYGDPPEEDPYYVVDAYAMRIRWVIPSTFPGSYFLITWDIGEYPDGGTPFISTADQTWEWTGPGDPEAAATWKSGWFEVLPPSSAGRRRIVNIRFLCYHGTKYGVKPQVTGEAL